MKRWIQKVLQWCVVACVAASLNACHAEQGRVTDEVTSKSIAGAQIVVYWTGRMLNPGPEPSSLWCYRVTATTSDANGKFDIPAFSGNFNPFLLGRLRQVSVVARGYRSTPKTEYKELLFSMRPLADPKVDPDGAREDYEYLKRKPGSSCGDEKLLLGYLKVRHYNLQMLASSEKDNEYLRGDLFGIEAIEFGETFARLSDRDRTLEYIKSKQSKDGQK